MNFEKSIAKLNGLSQENAKKREKSKKLSNAEKNSLFSRRYFQFYKNGKYYIIDLDLKKKGHQQRYV